VRIHYVLPTDLPAVKKELRVMKLLAVIAVVAGIFAAPLFATPMDAFTLYALLGAAALGFAIASRTISRRPLFVLLPAHLRAAECATQ
jgi:hypothetical protein